MLSPSIVIDFKVLSLLLGLDFGAVVLLLELLLELVLEVELLLIKLPSESKVCPFEFV